VRQAVSAIAKKAMVMAMAARFMFLRQIHLRTLVWYPSNVSLNSL
jgi:hypothetical protein